MIVFSNTTPFIALSSIDQLDLLPKLFGTVHVATAVIDECAEGGRIMVPSLTQISWVIPVADEASTHLTLLFELDRGEKQTILLAQKNKADKVIIDERMGRNCRVFRAKRSWYIGRTCQRQAAWLDKVFSRRSLGYAKPRHLLQRIVDKPNGPTVG